MSTLDNPQVIDPKSVSPWNLIVRYGAIGGLILIAWFLISNLLGIGQPGSISGALIGMVAAFAIYIGLMVVSIKKHREGDLGGLIPFGRAFLVAFGVGLIANVIGSIFTFIYTSYIDPTYFETAIERTMEMYENMGMSEDQIDVAMESVKKSMNGTTFLLQGIGGGSVVGAIVSLIVAAVMKKNPPEA